MTAQENKRVQDLMITFIKAMNPLHNPSSKNNINTATDIRYFHSLNEQPDADYIPEGFVDEDLNKILEMSDEELDSELEALGFDEKSIDQNIAICTGANVIPLNKTKEKRLDLEIEVEQECMFQSELMSVLIDDALYKSITLSREKPLPTATSPDDGSNEYFDQSKIAEAEEARELVVYEDQTTNKPSLKYGCKAFNRNFGIAASLIVTVVTVTAISAGLLKETKLPVEKVARAENNQTELSKNTPVAIADIKRDGHPGALPRYQQPTKKVANTIVTEINNQKQVLDNSKPAVVAGIKRDGHPSALPRYQQPTKKVVDTIVAEINNQQQSNKKAIDIILPETKLAALYGSFRKDPTNQTRVGLRTATAIKVSQTNDIGNEATYLNFDYTMDFLDKLSDGKVEASSIERLKILHKLLEVANKNVLKAQLESTAYQSSNTCAAVGKYEHVVTPNDSLSGIIEDCAYRLNDSDIFEKNQVLKVGYIVSMNVDEKRFITSIDLEKLDGKQSNIYTLSKN